MSINIGVRVELWSNQDPDGELLASVSREDLAAEVAPAIGETFAPSGLGDAMLALVQSLEVTNVEHYLSGPGVSDSAPLVIASARCQIDAVSADVREVLEDLRVAGWHVSIRRAFPPNQ